MNFSKPCLALSKPERLLVRNMFQYVFQKFMAT